MQLKNLKFILPVLMILLAAATSCRKNQKTDSNPALTLAFSTDTVLFDTVLATVGSVTKRLMVYNNNEGKLVVSQIRLGGGSSSMYRINVNGTPSTMVENIEIPGKDSIFIFVKVTVNPNNLSTPFIVSDSILFTTNTNLQAVQLAACGQNADFNINKTLKGQHVWDSLKAHVVYGTLRLDTGSLLTVMPGTKIYLHKKGRISVSNLASVKMNGTWNHPIRIQSDRLDEYYRDLPGQWDRIILERGSIGNSISNTVIKNGNYGIVIDSLPPGSEPKLNMDGVIIENFVYDGIYAYATSIVSTNCVIGNCGGAALYVEKGGSYDFRQLTVGNYWTASVRSNPSIVLKNFTYDSVGAKIPGDLVKAFFGNIILYGTETEELGLDSTGGAMFSYMFDHAILKTTFKLGNQSHYLECTANKDPMFTDIQKFDYSLDSLSPALGKGAPMGVTYDIRGNLRPSAPALGAYEYLKKN